MMSSDGEEYGGFQEDYFAKVLSEPSQNLPSRDNNRSTKRRRISLESDDSIEDFLDEEYENSEEHGENWRKRNRSLGSEEVGEETVKKKKSKYKIHIPRDHAVPPMQIQYGTQIGGHPDSSPERIRGAIWKLPKKHVAPSREKLPITSTTNIMKAMMSRPSPQGQLSKPNLQPVPRSTSLSQPISRPNLVRGPILIDEDEVMELPTQGLEQTLGPSPVDMAHELANLPSDAFSSSPEKDSTSTNRSNGGFSQPGQRLVAPQNDLRQTTLFGGRVPAEERPTSQINKVHNYRVDAALETPTHHKLDQDALKTWIYPTNLGKTREYQFNIVRQGLFSNMLVALPTGLGKTFIAAAIMLNYFRWTKDAQIVFMAPTKPLVSQQVDACFNIVGIPRSATTMLTGEINPVVRAEEWKSKRVFFMTPQTLDNDLRTGICDAKRIVLLVVDEAHRAKGEYSYVKVVTFLRRFNSSFRVLALTATPGSSVEAVQEVIDGLEISKVEIRTEESMDIQQYTHTRKIEQIILEPSDEIIMIKDLFSKALQPLVNQLCGQNAYYNRDPMSLTAYGLMKAQQAWVASVAARGANQGVKGMMRALFTILASVAHGIKLLNFHGVGPFYECVKEFRSSVEAKGEKGSKYKKQIVDNPDFKKMMDRIMMWISKDDFVGHPKLTFLCDTVLNHFLDAGEGRLPDGAPPSSTRVIVFSEYRDSAEDIVRVLNRHGPMIRASVFVGQADSKRSQGMNQTTQLETIRKFKAGTFNVIVATSIGEEGLDIGQVDLIVCYDASSSPIRMLQRMGRTGRKRAGNIVLLLMKGKEEESFQKAKDNYEQMQKMIASGTRFNFRHDMSTRIVPKEITPVVHKRLVEIPPENTQDSSLPEPKRRPSKKTKRPAKKFHMPDGVETGFRKASRLIAASDDEELEEEAPEPMEEEAVDIPPLNSVLLNASQLKQLERTYQNVYGEGLQEVSMPELNNQAESQRTLRPVKLVRHGQATKNFVRTITAMNNITDDSIDHWQQIFDGLTVAESCGLFSVPRPLSNSESEASRMVRQAKTAPKKRKEPKLKRDQPKQSLLTTNASSDSDAESQEEAREASKRAPKSKSKVKDKSNPSKRYQRGHSIDIANSSSGSDLEDDDSGEDLLDFIDDSTPTCHAIIESSPTWQSELELQEQLLSQSTVGDEGSNVPPLKKRFFEPTNFTATQNTNDDDELPELGTLVRGKFSGMGREENKENEVTDEDEEDVGVRRRAKRKRVVLDSDDDE